MIPFDIIFEPERWSEALRKTTRVDYAEAFGVSVVDKATASGRPSVFIRIDMPDGRIVMAQTTARLFCTAAKAIMARYPDLFEGD